MVQHHQQSHSQATAQHRGRQGSGQGRVLAVAVEVEPDNEQEQVTWEELNQFMQTMEGEARRVWFNGLAWGVIV